MTLVVRLVAAVFAALLSVPSASAISLATPVAVSHEYASHYDSAALNYTTPERGPPKTYNGRTNDDAVDRWSRGTSARSNGPAPTPLYAYDHPALLVPAASVATTRGGDVVRHDGVLSSPDRSKVAANTGTELRKVGSVLETVDDVMANPSLLRGRHPALVENILKDTPGWRIEKLGDGSQAGRGWVFRQYTERGHPTGPQLRWHPGGGHHGPDPYWRVVGPNGDLGGIIR